MRPSFAPLSALALASAVAALACSGKEAPSDADAAPGGDGGDDTAPCVPDASATPEKCQACVDATCPDTWNACLADTACVAQINCISACSGASCEAQCQKDHPSPQGDAVLGCLRGACKGACTNTICT